MIQNSHFLRSRRLGLNDAHVETFNGVDNAGVGLINAQGFSALSTTPMEYFRVIHLSGIKLSCGFHFPIINRIHALQLSHFDAIS